MGIFLKDVLSFIEEVETKSDKVVYEVVSNIAKSLINWSPIDTGNFVTNWLVGLDGNVPWGVTGYKNKDPQFWIDKTIAKIPLDASKHNYNFANNTRYAIYLEEGHSKKHAPYGIVSMTELAIPKMVKDVIKKHTTS